MKAVSLKRDDRSAQVLRNYNEKPFVSHEREELVEKLLSSEDPGLREVGLREMENLKLMDPTFKIIKRR